MITAAARRSPAVREPDTGRLFLPNITAADSSVSSQSLMTLAGVASLQLPPSEVATRAPVVVAQKAGDAQLAQAREAEAEQAGRDADLVPDCEGVTTPSGVKYITTPSGVKYTSGGKAAARPWEEEKSGQCNPFACLVVQVVERCCSKCGPFKRGYDRMAAGKIVASLRLTGQMGRRRHLLRGKELWHFLCRKHDVHMCSSEIHNVVRRDTRQAMTQEKARLLSVRD